MSAVLDDVVGEFAPGTLVQARGREWLVLPRSTPTLLRLRPLGGSEREATAILTALESVPPRPAVLDLPQPERSGNHDAAMLLKDAVSLKLRSGAGPFRSLGQIAVEPRAYQLVPLMMALKQSVIRLLIADDVGIGKTIEAGLIARELWDRGEIDRFAVLCPPHLVDQWVGELNERFHLDATALTARNAESLERALPDGTNLFDEHHVIVTSLDYIKSDRHRDHFLAIAPDLVIVDEAHTCAGSGPGRHLRLELLRRLSASAQRHMVYLTATPHSGDDVAFHNLLGLLKPEFAQLLGASDQQFRVLREDLANHFVQRQRQDIAEWNEMTGFPKRMVTEVTYKLTGQWAQFFDQVQAYCTDLAQRTEAQGQSAGRLIWYATLALLRCAGSSPAAAERALSTRLDRAMGRADAEPDNSQVIDGAGTEEDFAYDDAEPSAQNGALPVEITTLQGLITQARQLQGASGDPKLAALTEHLVGLVNDGFRPVVFCRYIATAHYVAEHLQKKFRTCQVEAITGMLPAEEREQRVQVLGATEHPILVATDCLSEGINLQHAFTAVVHYDLAWNPTRHEQREGRVDRFGQSAPEVRCTMLYGQDNPVDGFVLKVILKKAEIIRRDLGVLVPMPSNDRSVTAAMVKAAMMKRQQQLGFDFDTMPEAQELTLEWTNALDKARVNRTRFRQARLKPQDVWPEWKAAMQHLGTEADVQRFVINAALKLGGPLQVVPASLSAFRLFPQNLQPVVRERLEAVGIMTPTLIDFSARPQRGATHIPRSHPLVAVFADVLLESALEDDVPLAARCAATVTADVDVVSTLYLLRLRHQIHIQRGDSSRLLMVEEMLTLGVRGRTAPDWCDDAEARQWLQVKPSANLPREQITREVSRALDLLATESDRLADLAKRRAQALLADHRRLRDAADDRGQFRVLPCLSPGPYPVDVLGVYVLLPDSL